MARHARPSPALVVAALALFVALGGSVYAAARIDGRTIRVKSLPGNRLKPASVPGNRLKPGAIAGNRLAPGSITGNQIDAATLGQVPTAVHADNATSARDAETALNAINAVNATKLNGRSAACHEDERVFAGACWQQGSSDAALNAPAAAAACASRGSELPEALLLAAFAQQPGIVLAHDDEWSGDISGFSGPNVYAVAVVSSESAVHFVDAGQTKKFRCVTPLVS